MARLGVRLHPRRRKPAAPQDGDADLQTAHSILRVAPDTPPRPAPHRRQSRPPGRSAAQGRLRAAGPQLTGDHRRHLHQRPARGCPGGGGGLGRFLGPNRNGVPSPFPLSPFRRTNRACREPPARRNRSSGAEPTPGFEPGTCRLQVVRGGVREGPSWCVVAAQRGYADSDRHRRIRVDDADWPPRWHHRKTHELAPLSEKGEITSALVVTRSDGYLHFPGNPDAFRELVNAVSAETPRSGCLWVEPLTCTPSR
jgi:hypothetical protein